MKKVILFEVLLTCIVVQSMLAQSPQLSNLWLSNNAQVINAELPGKEDLQLLKNEIGDKRIVFLGEATHEDGATFEVRTKIVEFLMEEMDGLKFKIGPKSFFQTNYKQALNLYRKTLEFAEISENDVVYDLYTGTGTIAQYIAKKAKEILFGITKSVVSTSGSITDRLRDDWELVNVMKEINLPKYRILGLTEMEERKFGQQIEVIKDWTKRNDHRHHAMDALTIAFTKHNHIQYLNFWQVF